MHSLYPLLRACKYSFEPNRLGYCGPEAALPVFGDFIRDPMAEKMPRVKELLKGFYGAYSYMELIAEKNNIDVFSKEVIEAYWIGSPLTESVQPADLGELILSEFTKPGLLPKSVAEKLASTVPKNVVATHSFHVLHVNFITPKVEKIVKNLDACLVKWAEVKSVEEDGLLVQGVSLSADGGKLELVEKEKKIAKGSVHNPKSGDIVTEHWGSAVEIISEEELPELKKYTEQNLNAISTL